MTASESSALEVLETIEPIIEMGTLVAVQFAVGGRAHVLLPEHIGIRIIPVLVLVDCRRGLVPVLVDHSTKAIQAGVLVSRSAGATGLADVGQLRTRLWTILLHDGTQAQVAVF